MSLTPINHWALTTHGSVHDEEALTSLELQARTVAKVNQAVQAINQQMEVINQELDKLEGYAVEEVENSIRDGKISTRLNDLVWETLNTTFKQLDNRINNLVINATPDNISSVEVIDAREGYNENYPTLGTHVRALGNGNAFSDAVRPGTVKAGRIMAGMTGGDLRDKYTLREDVPMAGHWTGEAGYFDRNLLGFQGHSGYKMTDKIPCKYGDTFVLVSYLFGPSVYPAVFFNSAGQCVAVEGKPGNSDSGAVMDEVHVTRSDITHVSFVCLSGFVSDFRCFRVSMKETPERDTYANGRGYIHARAKKRTDTITDRAQIKCWFPLPEDRTGVEHFAIPLQLLKYTNLANWTFRLFAATSDTTYDTQLPFSASAYNFQTNLGIRPTFIVPLATAEGIPVTHVCLFVDLLPARDDEYINAYLPPLYMQGTNGATYPGTGYALHGHLDTDTLNVVWPGAGSSPLYNKRIIGFGDSLMSGNTLRKEKTWFNMAAGARDMVHFNAAVNGRAIAGTDSMDTNADTILAAFPNPDYAIIQGGANDLRLNIDLTTYRSGLESLISKIRTAYPRCKILLATNWRRSNYVNGHGHVESDYVDVMLEVGENARIPVVNNWSTGLDLTDPAVSEWADEAAVAIGETNLHFSEEAHRYIAPTYINALEAL